MPKIIPKETVKIVNSRGEAQLSPDLAITDIFRGLADFGRKQITLWNTSPRGELRVWFPAPRSRSPRICLGRLIKQIGLDPKDMVGNVYRGKIINHEIRIAFNRRKVK